MAAHAELQVTSNYSFLRDASHIEELFAQASLLGLKTLGITDRNSLAASSAPTSAPPPPASALSSAAGSI